MFKDFKCTYHIFNQYLHFSITFAVPIAGTGVNHRKFYKNSFKLAIIIENVIN